MDSTFHNNFSGKVSAKTQFPLFEIYIKQVFFRGIKAEPKPDFH